MGTHHESGRAAAASFVRAAERHHDEAVPTKEYPNPEPGRVRFYLLCFDGVRTIDADADALKKGTDRRSELWTESQRVLVELRFSYRVNRQETIIIWTKTVRHERNRRFAQSEMRYSSAAAPFADLLRCV